MPISGSGRGDPKCIFVIHEGTFSDSGTFFQPNGNIFLGKYQALFFYLQKLGVNHGNTKNTSNAKLMIQTSVLCQNYKMKIVDIAILMEPKIKPNGVAIQDFALI